ncbi:MAG: putative hydroxymethylpyrimidine transport system substrate-binding protein [Thermoleophilaceae bacterium]|jgi:putative hydroxymethylpyrimidine transport system substrate-binding protein|nr:putative hydroxymethylpyrimidine transport system substrate-binding protein [Thermoleophilaceae bacterium]
MRRAIAIVLLAAVAAAGCGDEGNGAKPKPVTVALDFTPNAAHAGLYAARLGGRDTRQGVRLRIRTPSSSSDSLKLLATGRADIAVADIHDLGLARERGSDLVGIGALVQRPLAAVIAGPGVKRPRELEGKRVGVTGVPSDDAVLRSVVEGDGGNPKRVHTVTIGFSAVASLVAHKVAAATAFWNVEGVTLRRRGVHTREFRVDAFGAPRYPELVLVVRRQTLESDRGRLVDAVAAIADGVRAAKADPGPALAEVARASDARPAEVRAEFDAVRPALEPPVTLDRTALENWATFDVRFGILRVRPDVSRAFDFTVAAGA